MSNISRRTALALLSAVPAGARPPQQDVSSLEPLAPVSTAATHRKGNISSRCREIASLPGRTILESLMGA
jgi:hypothetical protein